MKRRHLVLLSLLAASLLTGVLVDSVSGVHYRAEVEEHVVELPLWPTEGEDVRVLVLGDFHGKRWDGEWIDEIVRRSCELQPDLILLAGDYITWPCRRDCIPPEELARRLKPLATAAPVFYVRGNHDIGRASNRLIRLFDKQGFINAEKHILPLRFSGERSLILCGRNRPLRTLSKSRGPRPLTCDFPLTPVVTLVHDPRPCMSRAFRADLTIAGHTHGGQICLPGGRPLFSYWGDTPELLRSGMKRDFAGQPLYITRGLGYSHVPIRLFCPPEITLLRLRGTGNTRHKPTHPAF